MSLKRYDRFDGLLAVTCFVISLFLYIRTLTPGLLHGDSGEFQTLAYLLGHTHPTGYPVYLVLAKLATFLPLGDIAYRVNLFSALMAALTVAGVYLSGRLLVNYRALALIGAMALAISPTFWSQAIIAEVYTAGAAFLALILLALLWWDQTNKPLALFLAGILGGLSLGVHMSVALLAPAVLLFIIFHWRRGKKVLLPAFGGASAGVILTILMFWLMDLNNPTANYFNSIIEPSRSAWGLAADEIDGPLERLFFGWSARQFHSFMFANIANVMPRQATDYWQKLPLELGRPLIWLAVLGTVTMLIRRMRVGFLLIIGLAIQLFYMFNYEIWDLYVFYIPSYVLLSILSIAGMGTVIDLGMVALRPLVPIVQIRWMNLALESVIGLLVFGFALWPVFQPQKEVVLAGEVPFEFDEYPVYDESLLEIVRATVLELPEHAVVFTDWDMVWPYYYAAHIIEGRTDLTFIETYPADDLEGVADSVINYVIHHQENTPIFFSERESSLLKAGYAFTPARIGPTRLLRVIDD
jgi:hypothetical protein